MADIKYSGPLFDGRAMKALKDFADEAEDRILEDIDEELHVQFVRYFKHRTGRYESSVKIRGNQITDGNIVYGSWLEGTSSKNMNTVFKGYHIFENVSEDAESQAVHVAEVLLRTKYLRRMN
jgi:hypothetical protein